MNFTYKQPYVTWKGPSTGSAVPTWSRPLINNNTNTNTGTSFAARPIKHWRKQLVPAANTGISGRSHVGMPMDRPGGSVYLHSAGYLGATVDCSNCPVNLTDLIPTTKNTIFDTTKDASGNCVACNPETNIIKSGITLLNKNYYSDTKAYLQSQCQTYDQKLSITPIPGNSYINSITHQPIPPSDSPTGSQVYYTENCSKKCATVNSVVRTIYKPNNQQYSQQGSVSSSSRLTRLKNNTMTKNGNSFKTAWGQQGANAGRYQGSSDSSYFIKTKNQECVPHHRTGNKTISCNSIVTFSCGTGLNCTVNLSITAPFAFPNTMSFFSITFIMLPFTMLPPNKMFFIVDVNIGPLTLDINDLQLNSTKSGIYITSPCSPPTNTTTIYISQQSTNNCYKVVGQGGSEVVDLFAMANITSITGTGTGIFDITNPIAISY